MNVFKDMFSDKSKVFFSLKRDTVFGFLFENKRIPSKVYKIKEYSSIYKEYKNHSLAIHLIPDHVAGLYSIKKVGGFGIMCMEYLESILFFDFVASRVAKAKAFFKGAEKLFSFLITWLGKLPRWEMTLKEIDVISKEFPSMPDKIKSIYLKLKDERVFSVPQHRDFSTSNLRFAGKDVVLLDWEDMEFIDLPTTDYAALTFSIFDFYKNFFKKELLDSDIWVRLLDIMRKTKSIILARFLSQREDCFNDLLILSLFSFIRQNLNKKRFLTAGRVMSFLNFYLKRKPF